MDTAPLTEKFRKTGMTEKHKQLQDTAVRWLYEKGCSVYAKEVPTKNGNADALGIKTPRDRKETIYYIEAKASRSDLICLKQKRVYLRSVGTENQKCYYHTFGGIDFPKQIPEAGCAECLKVNRERLDTGIDFYYLIIADGVKVEDTLYPEWGIISEVEVENAKPILQNNPGYGFNVSEDPRADSQRVGDVWISVTEEKP
jgi:hypothetical protein